MESERIQKLLARAGFGSRREIERLIAEGQVEVNGKLAQLGDRINADDTVKLRGVPVSFKQAQATFRPRIIAYHKPVGEVVTQHDPEGRPTVFGKLPPMKTSRWIAVGRLDINTSGLLLFTNDGELANRLMHPSYQVEREYSCRIHGDVDDAMLQRLVNGVELEDGPARFHDIVPQGDGESANRWFFVLLAEGRNREVRRIWESQGVEVSRLVRVRYGPLFLERRVRPGRWEEITGKEFDAVYKEVGLTPPKVRAPEPRAGRGAPAGRGRPAVGRGKPRR